MSQLVTLPIQAIAEATGPALLITLAVDGRPAGPDETPDDETGS